MSLKKLLKSYVPSSLLKAKLYIRDELGLNKGSITEFQFDSAGDVGRDIKSKFGFDGDLLDIFINNKGCALHKWHHYIPIYDRYFHKFRGTKVKFLEIGVSKGGSLQMWRSYFGPEATIYGIDIDPACRALDGVAGSVRIGSQDDKAFLESVIAEMGGVDIVLDDGSHHMAHVHKSLEILFMHVSDGGVYMIEDLGSAYWGNFGGGYYSRNNFFNYVRSLIDDMHFWYHNQDIKHDISKSCSGIHVHDSIVVLEKNKVFKPVHSIVE